MTLVVKHTTQAGSGSGPGGLISETEWESTSEHALSGTANRLVGLDSSGDGEEVTPGSGLQLASGALDVLDVIIIPVTSENGLVVAGAGKATFRMPYAMTLTDVRASVKSASASGGPITIDINEGGASIFSTLLTIDDTEKTSETATPASISDASLADDAEITIDVDDAGDGLATGLKVQLHGYRT